MPWTTDFEPSPPPDAAARDILAALYDITDEVGEGPIWFSELSERQQLAVLRYHCREGGWPWPPVYVVASRRMQGLPDQVEDPTTLKLVARALTQTRHSMARR